MRIESERERENIFYDGKISKKLEEKSARNRNATIQKKKKKKKERKKEKELERTRVITSGVKRVSNSGTNFSLCATEFQWRGEIMV